MDEARLVDVGEHTCELLEQPGSVLQRHPRTVEHIRQGLAADELQHDACDAGLHVLKKSVAGNERRMGVSDESARLPPRAIKRLRINMIERDQFESAIGAVGEKIFNLPDSSLASFADGLKQLVTSVDPLPRVDAHGCRAPCVLPRESRRPKA
jgi:hypothetical protein